MQNSSNLCKSAFHSCHFLCCSMGISSSQPNFSLQRSCKICLPGSMTGAAKPSGSYMEHTVDKRPRLVSGWSFTSMLKPNVSVSADQSTPSARSTGRLSCRSKDFMDFALSSSGTDSSTRRSLDPHLVSRKPPLCRTGLKSLMRDIASTGVGTEVRQSST